MELTPQRIKQLERRLRVLRRHALDKDLTAKIKKVKAQLMPYWKSTERDSFGDMLLTLYR